MSVYCAAKNEVTFLLTEGDARMEQEFYTLKGYQRFDTGGLTASQEDYLEMICRTLRRGERVRVNELAQRLHVKPSSVSKMLAGLRDEGYLAFERYGCITATPKGMAAGEYLLHRHDILQDFLRILNGPQSELEEVEKIEHFLGRETVENLERLTRRMKEAP